MEAKFFKFLRIVGVGIKAKAEAEGRKLFLKVGYSHDLELNVPPAVRVVCLKNNIICCAGIHEQRVNNFASVVRSCKPPNIFTKGGIGIRYADENVIHKEGKKNRKAH